jgi:hypothetical protein
MRDDDDLWTVGEATLAKRVAKAKGELDRAAKGDRDGIHDLRVAIRKVRATLSILAGTVVEPDITLAAEHDVNDVNELFHALEGLVDTIVKNRKEAKREVRRPPEEGPRGGRSSTGSSNGFAAPRCFIASASRSRSSATRSTSSTR